MSSGVLVLYSRKLHGVALHTLFHTVVSEIVLALFVLGCWLSTVACCSWVQSMLLDGTEPTHKLLSGQVSSGCCWELADVDVCVRSVKVKEDGWIGVKAVYLVSSSSQCSSSLVVMHLLRVRVRVRVQ